MERLEKQEYFVNAEGWGEADIFPLPVDASNRTYTRLIKHTESCLVMNAPPSSEKLPEFMAVSGHLNALGLKAPRVYASDTKEGFALIEDFGDTTYTVLLADGAEEQGLYFQAVDVLIHVHRSQPEALKIDLPLYDLDLMLEEVSRFLKWYVPAIRGRAVTKEEEDQFLEAWAGALSQISRDHTSFVFRDFHVDNLMILPGQNGLKAVGLLDFQDALVGSPVYDIMSLLCDARRDVSPSVRAASLERYFSAFPDTDPVKFMKDFNLLCVQRQTKIAGIFARMATERGQYKYLEHMPRLRRMITEGLSAPELKDVRAVMQAMLPDFETAEIEPQPASVFSNRVS